MTDNLPEHDPRAAYEAYRETYDKWAEMTPETDHERLLHAVGEAMRAAASKKERESER